MRRSTLLVLAAAAVAACGEMPTDPTSSVGVDRPQMSMNGNLGNSGAIWTTRQCEPAAPQNANHYAIGEMVYINGAGFAPNESLDWFVRGNPGGSSADPDIIVASGNGSASATGSFCFPAYLVQADDDGEYRANVNGKNDNYRVSGISVTKTATPMLVSSYDWTIAKTAAPSTLNLFQGDEGVTRYTVVATRLAPINQYSVSGVISITNTHPAVGTRTVNVQDCIQYRIGGGAWTDYQCVTVASNVTVGPGAKHDIEYGPIGFTPNASATEHRNSARVTVVGGSELKEALAPFVLPTVATSTVNASVSVADPKDPSTPRTVTGTTSFHYDATYTCTTGTGSRTESNTATLTGLGGLLKTSTANVTVNCRSLAVSKTANTAYNRTYAWQIGKTAALDGLPVTSPILLAEPGSRTIGYTVTLTGTFANSGFAASGRITVTNTVGNGVTAKINSVSDVVSPSIAASITGCSVSFPAMLEPGGTFTCDYTVALPDNTARTNTATVVRQRRHFAHDGTGTDLIGTQQQTATASVTFGVPTVETNKCVNVTDNFNSSGDVALSGGTNYCHPGVGTPPSTHVKTFTYTRELVSGAVCTSKTYSNTAKFVAVGNAGYNGSASADVTLTVACGQCTLTQGYWKNHADPATSRYDDTWAKVGGRDALFLNSGMTWIQVFDTAPKGDVWFNLAHQYMAAVLNKHKGADTSAINQALIDAEELLRTYGPGSNVKSVRNNFVSLAGILGSYNEGTLPGGPKHCD
jgi:hypothetical protein